MESRCVQKLFFENNDAELTFLARSVACDSTALPRALWSPSRPTLPPRRPLLMLPAPTLPPLRKPPPPSFSPFPAHPFPSLQLGRFRRFCRFVRHLERLCLGLLRCVGSSDLGVVRECVRLGHCIVGVKVCFCLCVRFLPLSLDKEMKKLTICAPAALLRPLPLPLRRNRRLAPRPPSPLDPSSPSRVSEPLFSPNRTSTSPLPRPYHLTYTHIHLPPFFQHCLFSFRLFSFFCGVLNLLFMRRPLSLSSAPHSGL